MDNGSGEGCDHEVWGSAAQLCNFGWCRPGSGQLCNFGGQRARRCERRGKVKAEQENNVISKLYNFGGLALDLLPQGVSKGGASTGLNFATLGRACLSA